MTELTIRPVDVDSDADLATWTAVVNAVDLFERGEHATPWALQEVTADLRAVRKDRRMDAHLALLDGEPVAAGLVELPLLDNLSAAEIGVWVLPEHRRRGHGSALLAVLEAAALAHGRTRYDAFTDWAYAGPEDGAGVPGVEFGRRHGYAFGLGNIQREARLPVDADLLDRLAAGAAPHAAAYTLRSIVGRFPDGPGDEELLVGYLSLAARLFTEAPSGDLEVEDEAVDLEAFRASEEVLAAQGRTAVRTLAVAGDGEVAAYTDLVVPSADTSAVFQWGTLVDPRHRGSRLGLAVKVANLIALQERPDLGGGFAGRRLVTWNAEVNTHMIAINEVFGFVPVARGGELQKKVSGAP
ncbi:GNAT family N-acetyltransferase [Nocardioides sp. GY 10113]|uniref:GNAT family N-acetyltransferase n=1 Tax=Nocardioides sp. GY 10113 TaxID=2569761 RepID=UPI0010A77C66|nr:GNAT family N-acetyltransferase [Nocardioides sp. GY 10113]TIC86310.1 GNAT family N-acetyltransferase [Nocardioides sp. GY 10113]